MGRLLGFGSNPIHPIHPAGCSALMLGYMITIPLKPFLQAWGSGEAKEPDQGWPQLLRGVCASKPFPSLPRWRSHGQSKLQSPVHATSGVIGKADPPELAWPRAREAATGSGWTLLRTTGSRYCQRAVSPH